MKAHVSTLENTLILRHGMKFRDEIPGMQPEIVCPNSAFGTWKIRTEFLAAFHCGSGISVPHSVAVIGRNCFGIHALAYRPEVPDA